MSNSTDGTEDLSPTKRALLLLREMRSRLETLERAKSEPIAVVGMGCRFPGGATDVASFWDLLRNAREGIVEIPRSRWAVDAYYDPDPDRPGKICARGGGFLQDIDAFDAAFFGISPHEAATMDPQQRLLLEVAWEALENAGHSPSALFNSRTGVFVGVGNNDYLRMQLARIEDIDAYVGTGNASSIVSGRLSYLFGLRGPSLTVDTACSSSLVTVHLAVQSLRARECDLALAAGVNLILSPEVSINFTKARMLAPDSRCKAFDVAADGYARGEGCGVAVLKRLSDALANRDAILGVVRGSAVNQDGRTLGLTAPSARAQGDVVREALANSSIAPHRVGYVETHGTGTPLGDPIEIQALGEALRDGRRPDGVLVIGSVKANLGHLEAAAGIAGFLKTILALHHGEIPPQRNFEQINPRIALPPFPLLIPKAPTAWPQTDAPRVAGVSAFSFSGTNAHLILEEAPRVERTSSGVERPLHVLTLSAKSDGALRELAARYVQMLSGASVQAFGDVCYTASGGRSHFEERLAVVAASADGARATLETWAAGEPTAGVFCGRARGPRRKIALVFPGRRPRDFDVLRQIYDTQPVFRAALDDCNAVLQKIWGRSLLEVLQVPEPPWTNEPLYAHPALFSVEYALWALWRAWGIDPDALIGHDVGEYVAACVAGVFTLEEGLRLIVGRASLIQTTSSSGAMEFERLFDTVQLHRPVRPIVSGLTGRFGGDELATPAYWCRHARSPVRFVDGIETLAEDGIDTFLELGLHPTSITPGATSLAKGCLCLPSPSRTRAGWGSLLETVAHLYVAGVELNWRAFDAPYARATVALPTYPWQRQRYWTSSVSDQSGRASALPPLWTPSPRDVDTATPEFGPAAGELREVPDERQRQVLRERAREIIAQLVNLPPSATNYSGSLLDLGLTSVDATVLNARLKAAFGRAVPMGLLFGGASIEAILDYLSHNGGAVGGSGSESSEGALGMHASGKPLHRIDRKWVHRALDRNVLITDVRRKNGGYETTLVPDYEHPFFFEHPADHVPGMMLIEAGRQMTIATGHQFLDVPFGRPFIMQELNIEMHRMADLIEPVTISMSVSHEERDAQGALARFRTAGEFLQYGKSIGRSSGDAIVLPTTSAGAETEANT